MTPALAGVLSRLRRVAPQAASRAERALSAALAATRASRWPEVAWSASNLTNTGFPVEWSWSSRDVSLRWTAETAAPETPEHERLECARRVLRELGVEVDVPAWLPPPPGTGLRFGAWLGGRHGESGDRYKLYVEVTDAQVPRQLAGDAVPSRTIWRMAGLDAGAGVLELYGKLVRPEVWEIERLFAAHGLDAGPAIALARQLTPWRDDDVPLSRTAGLSLALNGDRVVAAALLVHASPLLGGDEAVARKLRALAARHRWDTTLYDAILGDDTLQHPGRHGMFALGAGADGTTWMQIGLRP